VVLGLVFIFTLFLSLVALATFSDVPTDHPHAAAIKYVYDNDIVEGYDDGTYRPNNHINRVEFLKILLEYRGQTVNRCRFAADLYTDTDAGAWYMNYVYIATCDGVIEGYPDGSMRPADPINFAEVAKIITKDSLSSAMHEYGDEWHEKYIAWLDMWGAIPRADIMPEDLLTRGEMAENVYQMSSFK